MKKGTVVTKMPHRIAVDDQHFSDNEAERYLVHTYILFSLKFTFQKVCAVLRTLTVLDGWKLFYKFLTIRRCAVLSIEISGRRRIDCEFVSEHYIEFGEASTVLTCTRKRLAFVIGVCTRGVNKSCTYALVIFDLFKYSIVIIINGCEKCITL